MPESGVGAGLIYPGWRRVSLSYRKGPRCEAAALLLCVKAWWVREVQYALLDAAYPFKPDYLGGLEFGATPATGAIATLSYMNHRPVNTLFVRKKRKEHGTKLLIEGPGFEEGALVGKNVVVIDDVATRGQSIFDAVRAIREAGGTVTKAITLVDRGEGAVDFLKERGVDLISIFTAQEFLDAAA